MFIVFFKQKTAYELRISEWSSDVCSSDLQTPGIPGIRVPAGRMAIRAALGGADGRPRTIFFFSTGRGQALKDSIRPRGAASPLRRTKNELKNPANHSRAHAIPPTHTPPPPPPRHFDPSPPTPGPAAPPGTAPPPPPP